MRSIALSKSGLNRIRSFQTELKVSDFEESVKSIPPGEWCFFKGLNETWVGFINPTVQEKFTCAYALSKLTPEECKNFSVENFLLEKIKKAYEKRIRLQDYGHNSRIVYGGSDGLPGLIVDHFENASIVQINTAGLDRFRDFIKQTIFDLTHIPAYLLDNSRYREKESLPTFSNEALPELKIIENGLKYIIRPEVLQKVGFYYDHRENRYHLMSLIGRMSKKPSQGLDLFSYAGAWGISALKAGVKYVKFIDQGEFSQEVYSALKLNGLEDSGEFHRADVFKYLDESLNQDKKFDIVLCDPPAFAKSANQKAQALEGYSKLHKKVFKVLSPESVVAFSSCTHYVGHEEFQKNILDASYKENRKIQLVYSGMQGLDHPVASLSDKANYIKSYFYFVE